MPIAILYKPELKQFDYGPGHPFRGDRFEVFPRYLKKFLPDDKTYDMIGAEPAKDDDLLLICSKEYIDFTTGFFRAASLGESYPGNFSRFHSGDNYPPGRPGKVEEAARLVVGQAKLACDLVQKGSYLKAISIGGGMHHAKPNYGEGFCLYNDVAFAARYLINHYKLEKILILDTDAHAGNGTSEYFYSEPKVLFIDIHQDPNTLYPGTGFASQTGEGKGKGFNVNIPLSPGSGDESYRMVFESIVEPLAKEFSPQVIIRNGGSDPHYNDGLTNLGLTIPGFRMIGEKVKKMSEVCGGRVIDMIASGYNEKVLPYAWLSMISGLAGIGTDIPEPEPDLARYKPDVTSRADDVIQDVKNNIREYWKSMR
jgi:acetoin utilization protein AcuC